MNKIQYLAAWQASHDAPAMKVISIFLTIVFYVSTFFIKLKLKPNHITILGGLVGLTAAALFAAEFWLLAAFVAVLSSLLDGVDGAVAEITGQKSKFGALLDVTIDRIVEISLILVLTAAGASFESVTSAALAILILEYIRTKANSLGITGPGKITIAERPTRVVMFAMLSVGVWVIGLDNLLLTIGAWTLTALTAIGVIQLFFCFADQLRHNSGR